tara:strand:- start:218 stop:469 length:252 start_codon:yes stop_codon:yes gene_type:complete
MGNCIRSVKSTKKSLNDGFSENNILNEESPLLPNLNKLNKIFNKEICAVCETEHRFLTKIIDRNHPGLSNMVYCNKCKKILGY